MERTRGTQTTSAKAVYWRSRPISLTGMVSAKAVYHRSASKAAAR